MLKIRLTRRGKRNKAFFRLVVAEHTSPIKGKFIEALGFLNPHTKENNLNNERIQYWIERGAQCSDSAHNMLVKAGILKGPKRAVKMKKKEAEKTEEKKEEKPVSDGSPAPAEDAEDKPADKKEEAKIEKAVPEKEEKAAEPKAEAPKEEVAPKKEEEATTTEEAAEPKKAEKDIVGEEKKPA